MDSRLKSKLFKCCHFSCRVSTSGRLKRPSPERENQSLNLQALHKWRYHSGSGLSSCRNAIYTVWVVLYENWILKVTLPEKSVWDWSFLNCFFWEKGYVCHWLPGIITPLCPECAQGTKPGFGRFLPAPLEEKLSNPGMKIHIVLCLPWKLMACSTCITKMKTSYEKSAYCILYAQ